MKQTDDIIESSKLAGIAKLKNPKVINGTIGVLYDDNGKLVVYNSVKKIVDNIDVATYYGYSSVDGGLEYKNNTLKFIFGSHLEEFKNNFEMYAMPTPGSTLAIFLALSIFNKNCKDIILPNYYWSTYDNMIDFYKLKKHKYNYINDKGFDIESFAHILKEISNKKRSIYILFNDPANNPTGYSLTKDEWNSVIELLNKYPDNRFYIILDIAYLDFREGDYSNNRDYFIPFLNLGKNSLVTLCYSGSKTFGSYGLRVGSIVFFSRFYKLIYKLTSEAPAYARAIWSTVPSAGLEMFKKLTSDSDAQNQYIKELHVARQILKQRAQIFLEDAKDYGLDVLPYKSGFFVTIKSLTPKRRQLELMKKNIYTVALNGGIRVAISGIPIDEIRGLVKKIKETIG